MLTTTRIALSPDPRSARAAREFVGQALNGDGGEQGEIAQLLVSELVTNALLHARTTITLVVQVIDSGVRVGVADGSHRGPRQRDYSDEATTGRGLTLVEALASSWGTEPSTGGKTIWFELTDEAMAS